MNKRKIHDDTTSEIKKKKPNGFWKFGLLETASDPNYLIKSDNLVYVIKDKYPKAKFHYLVMPKENITSIKAVTSEHASLLEHMENVALELTKTKEHEKSCFKIGYHCEPSMFHLHLHVISDDFVSDALKTKQHWNSFTTEFFMESEAVRNNLEKNGKLVLPFKYVWQSYMRTELKCHKCDFVPKNMPELKKHILTHLDK